jgi:hypothetical protein
VREPREGVARAAAAIDSGAARRLLDLLPQHADATSAREPVSPTEPPG